MTMCRVTMHAAFNFYRVSGGGLSILRRSMGSGDHQICSVAGHGALYGASALEISNFERKILRSHDRICLLSLWLSSILLCFHDLGLQVQLPAWWSPNHYSSPCASGVLAQARGGVAYCLHSVPLTLALAPRHMSLFTLTFVPDSLSQSLLHCYSV